MSTVLPPVRTIALGDRVVLCWRSRVGPHAVLLLLAVLALAPALVHGQWFNSHEYTRYALLGDHFRRAFFAGHLYPRWLPELYGGYGYPTFCYYPPAFFFVMLPFSFLPRHPLFTLYGATLFVLYLGALGAFKLTAALTGDRRMGLLGAVVFLLTPYLWVDLYVRGDLSELMGLLLTPWPLYFLARLGASPHARLAGPIAGLGVSLALIVLSHPAVALFYAPVLAVLALWQGLEPGARRRRLGAAAAGCVLGLALSSAYWFPVMQLWREAGLERMTYGYFEARLHVVAPWQLIWRGWGFGASVPGPGDGMSFQLGLVHACLAWAGFALHRRSRLVQASFAAYVGLVVLMTPLAGPLWKHLAVLKSVQFPWRILSVTAGLQLLCLSGLSRLPALVPALARRMGVVYAVAALAALLWSSNAFRIREPLDVERALAMHAAEDLMTMANFANMNEFLPRTVRTPGTLVPRGERIPVVEAPAPVRLEPSAGNSLYHLRYTVRTPAPATVTINQLFFPGWRVLLDDTPVAGETLRRRLTPDGRMVVAVPEGVHRLEAYYDGPPGWRPRVAVSGLVVALFAAAWLRERRRDDRP